MTTHKGPDKVKLHIYAKINTISKGVDWRVLDFEVFDPDSTWGMLVHTMDIPLDHIAITDKELTLNAIHQLNKEKDSVQAKAQATINHIEEQIQSLMAIEYKE